MPSSELEFSWSLVSIAVTRSGDFEDVPVVVVDVAVGVTLSRYHCQIPSQLHAPQIDRVQGVALHSPLLFLHLESSFHGPVVDDEQIDNFR